MSGAWPVLRVLAALAVGAAGACAPDFTEQSEVEGLRVLGVRAMPPELRDPGATELDALVVEAEGLVTYAWEVCLIPGNPLEAYPCLDEDALFDLGTASTATLLVPDVDELLASEEFRDYNIEVDLEEGVPVQVRLQVADASGASVFTVKNVTVSRRADQNRNPAIGGLTVEGAPWSEAQGIEVVEDQKVEMIPQWDPLVVEQYTEDDEEKTERLLFSWFATAGEFQKQRSDDDAPENDWTAPLLDEGEVERIVRLWLVQRDDRGGIDWTQRQIRVTKAPAER